MDKLYSLKQAANALNLAPVTLRMWCYRREVPFVKLGRRLLFRECDLQAFILKNLTRAKEQEQS